MENPTLDFPMMVNLALEQGVFQSVLSVAVQDFIVVVNNAATGITDFAPTQIPAIFKFVNRTSHTVDAIPAPGCQPFQAVIPIVRQGEHIGQQSLGFQGQPLIPQVVVAHNGVVDVFIDAEC